MNSPAIHPRAEQQEIDATAKWPVLVLFSQALAWLLIGGALELVAAVQLHTPGFLPDWAWFTPGRITAAASSVLVYGWGVNSGLAFALWLMARLSAAALRSGGWLIVACKFWNIGLGLGLFGILIGGPTPYPLLELPRTVTLLLLGAYALMAVWAVTTFSVRNTENVFAAQWYLLAALFSFPWLFLGAQVMLFDAPVRGVVQAVVAAWYVNGVHGLWFVPLALAALYYFLPKLTGRALGHYYLARLGFWWLIVCTAFAGGARLIGGPVPAWIPTVGIVAHYLTVPALVIVFVNLLRPLAGRFGLLQSSLTLRFLLLSLGAFVLLAVLNLLLSFRGFAVAAQFTFLTELRDWLAFYGVFSTAMFGAAYFLLPRVTGLAWPSAALVHIHFACTAVGGLCVVLALAGAGWIQGALLNDPAVPFADIFPQLAPWLVFRSATLILLLTGHLAFFINFVWLGLATVAGPRWSEPAVIAAPPALEGPHA